MEDIRVPRHLHNTSPLGITFVCRCSRAVVSVCAGSSITLLGPDNILQARLCRLPPSISGSPSPPIQFGETAITVLGSQWSLAEVKESKKSDYTWSANGWFTDGRGKPPLGTNALDMVKAPNHDQYVFYSTSTTHKKCPTSDAKSPRMYCVTSTS